MQNYTDWNIFLKQQNLVWKDLHALPSGWDSGAFLGNGCLGASVYFTHGGTRLHVELGRNDVYDTRPSGTGAMAKHYDTPRLPIGAIEYPVEEEILEFCMELELYQAAVTVFVRGRTQTLRCRIFVAAQDEIIAVEQFTGAVEKWCFIPASAQSPRQTYGLQTNDPVRIDASYVENVPAVVTAAKDAGTLLCVQLLCSSWKTVTAIHIAADKGTLACTVAQSQAEISQRLAEAVEQADITALWSRHCAWWEAYYPLSFVHLPDAELEKFYWLQMYKLGCLTREHSGVIDNQGPWLSTTPWPGTWWNLNVQLAYLPLYTANRLEISLSLPNTLCKYEQDLIENVPPQWRSDSAALGTTTTRGLKSKAAVPIADAGKQFIELGNLTWALHDCWLYYRMTMDENYLSQFLYPLLKRSVQYYLHFLQQDETGTLHLPLTESPEYGIACEDCNYELSLLRWGCEVLLEHAADMGETQAHTQEWKSVLQTLADYPTDENGYSIGKNLPYQKSHRHFSHLMMLAPLYLVNRDNSDTKALAETSVLWWHSKKGDIEGFSHVGAALIYAAYQEGDKALTHICRVVREYATCNTMYREAGPVIETPLATAECIQSLLLQSWGGKVRVFSAMPSTWKQASFSRLAAQGGFVVSAEYKNGHTTEIEITSRTDANCVIETDLHRARICTAGKADRVVTIEKTIKISIKKNETVRLCAES